MFLEDIQAFKPSTYGPYTNIASAIAAAQNAGPGKGIVIIPASYVAGSSSDIVPATPGAPVWDLRNSNNILGSNVVGNVNGNFGFAIFNAAAAVNLAPATAAAGLYRISLYSVITTLFVTGTAIVFTFGWTDAQAAKTLAFTGAALTTGTYTPPISSTIANSFLFQSSGTAAITYTPSATGTAMSAGAAQVAVTLERLA
jgi:hypothetical protein